jgi:hypothetical protein
MTGAAAHAKGAVFVDVGHVRYFEPLRCQPGQQRPFPRRQNVLSQSPGQVPGTTRRTAALLRHLRRLLRHDTDLSEQFTTINERRGRRQAGREHGSIWLAP